MLVFGSTTLATSTALAAFMGGLALGARYFGRRADRTSRPLALYGWLEIGIGLSALLVPVALVGLVPLQRLLGQTLGDVPAAPALVRLVLCLLVLLVPTTLMGGTLPALARFRASFPWPERGIGTLYGINTTGAFAGVVVAAFLLLPFLGHARAVWLAAVVNLAIGLAALLAGRDRAPRPSTPSLSVGGAERLGPRGAVLAAALTATGFAALALEVGWTRVLVLVVGPSVYAFALMLAAFLAGLGGGSVAWSAVIARGGRPERWLVGLIAASGVLAFATLHLFDRLPDLYAALFQSWGAGERPLVVFAAILATTAAVMLPAAGAMGGIFPAALATLGLPAGVAGRRVGTLYAANSAGAIAGALASGFVAIPLLGIHATVLAASAGYLAVAAALTRLAWRPRPALIVAAALLLAIPLLWRSAPPWRGLLLSAGVYHDPAGWDVEGSTLEGLEPLYYREGATSTVLVLRDPAAAVRLGSETVPHVFLVTNGKVDASSTGDMPTQVLSAHVPLLLHPDPRTVLVVGLASGTTAGSALRHPIESLDVVEIEPAIVEGSRAFDFVSGAPLDDPRTRLHVADGRTFLAVSERRWDVIVSEPSNPWMTGVSNLFTREYFHLARERLAPGGVYAQWFQTYRMGPESLETLLRTFGTVFPHVWVFNTIPYSDLLLVASMDPLRIDLDGIEARIAAPVVARDLVRVGVSGLPDLLARARIGPGEYAAVAGPAGPINTDDNAWIEFRAPLDLHRETRGANERALAAAARGVAPYLDAAQVASRPAFMERVAAAYRSLGFYGESAAASPPRGVASGGGTPVASIGGQ